MDIFGKAIMSVKTINPPKTHDPGFEAANENLKIFQVESNQINQKLSELSNQLNLISSTFLDMANNMKKWMTSSEGGEVKGLSPQQNSIIEQSIQNAEKFHMITIEAIVKKAGPNVIKYLIDYEEEIKKIKDIKKERSEALKKVDHYREKLRLIEKEKKVNQEQLERNRQKSDDANSKYEPLNKSFIDSVERLGEIRRTTLITPFKNLSAIVCQFIMQLNHHNTRGTENSTAFVVSPQTVQTNNTNANTINNNNNYSLNNNNNNYSNNYNNNNNNNYNNNANNDNWFNNNNSNSNNNANNNDWFNGNGNNNSNNDNTNNWYNNNNTNNNNTNNSNNTAINNNSSANNNNWYNNNSSNTNNDNWYNSNSNGKNTNSYANNNINENQNNNNINPSGNNSSYSAVKFGEPPIGTSYEPASRPMKSGNRSLGGYVPQGEELSDDGWNVCYNPVDQGYVQNKTNSITFNEESDDYSVFGIHQPQQQQSQQQLFPQGQQQPQQQFPQGQQQQQNRQQNQQQQQQQQQQKEKPAKSNFGQSIKGFFSGKK